MATERPRWLPADVDPTRPSVARVYDYYLGGSHNFEADREFARQVIARSPDVVRLARDNRAFLQRALRYTGGRGVDQYLDLGSGIPTAGNVHEVARACNPRARVVYVDHDPIAVTHSRALLAGQPGVTAIAGDITEPDAVLADAVRTGGLDLHRPVAVLLLSVLHFIPDERRPAELVARYLAATAPGSPLAISHGRRDCGSTSAESIAADYGRTCSPGSLSLRSHSEIAGFFAGTDLVEPGLVGVPDWRPELGDTPSSPVGECYPFLGGVGLRRIEHRAGS